MLKALVALITPFHHDGQIDYESLGKLIDRLLDEGCDGFIVCGTTAEVPTLRFDEKYEILDFVIGITKKRAQIWFGCGSNDTLSVIKGVKRVQDYDIDGILVVTPYYNKPSSKGLIAHYEAIANATNHKIMLYNVPSRTGVSLNYQTISTLIDHHSNIVGLKQASDDFDCVMKLKENYPDFVIYSGEDGSLQEGLHAGVDGIISVSGHMNLMMIKKYLSDYQNDPNTNFQDLKDFASITFCDASPAPIKYMLARKGYCENVLRLPLVGVSMAAQAMIEQYFDSF